jgi:pimeloyl-ACP methyl ester carboxylesterase
VVLTTFRRRVRVARDIDLELAEAGTGSPVLLIHAGVFGDWFQGLLDQACLVDRFHLLYPHRVGYGSSTPPSDHVSIEGHASHCAALLDVVAAGATHIVGHSSGALVALALALSRPDLVRSISLLEPALTDVAAHADLGPRVVGPAMRAFRSGDVEGAFDTFMAGMCGATYRAQLESALGPDGVVRAVRDSAYFFADETQAVLEWRFGTLQATQIDRPVLLVAGDRSAEVHPLFGEQLERAAQLFPKARRVVVAGTHMFPVQSPAALASALAEFFAVHA